MTPTDSLTITIHLLEEQKAHSDIADMRPQKEVREDGTIHFAPRERLFSTGDPLHALQELKETAASPRALPAARAVQRWSVVLRAGMPEQAVWDALAEVRHVSDIRIAAEAPETSVPSRMRIIIEIERDARATPPLGDVIVRMGDKNYRIPNVKPERS